MLHSTLAESQMCHSAGRDANHTALARLQGLAFRILPLGRLDAKLGGATAAEVVRTPRPDDVLSSCLLLRLPYLANSSRTTA